ncbi:MAG: WG repeat-containing protein [Planctomycetota bacterium]
MAKAPPPSSSYSSKGTLVLTLGISLVVTAVAAYFILGRTPPPPAEAKSEMFPFRDADTGKWGYLGQDARVAIPAKFDFADLFREGRGLVEVEGLAGYIDDRGQWAIAPRFVLDPEFSGDLAARPFWNGLAAARQNGAWGFIDTQGDWTILPRFRGRDGFEWVGDFHNQRAWFKDGRRYGFIDPEGNAVIEARYDAANDFSEGLAGVLIKDEWGMIDTAGKLRIRPDFDGIGTFGQGLCQAKKDDLWGYIDRRGDWAIQPKYAAALSFSEGLAPAYNGVAWGYITPEGSYQIKPRFDIAWPHENGLAAVEVDGQKKYIDANGRVAWPKPR